MDKKGEKIWQTSEHHILAWVLAIVGGYLDAYSYLCRGEVFANAQTGNIVLLSVSLIEQKWYLALNYLCPILAFVAGVFICELIKLKKYELTHFHWRQFVILIELTVVVFAGFIPVGKWDFLVNLMISFVCALQVEAFRKVKGNAFASTMCTGNLRSGTEKLFKFIESKDKKLARDCMEYYTVILFFIGGAAIGGLLTNLLGAISVSIAAIGLVIAYLLMTQEYLLKNRD